MATWPFKNKQTQRLFSILLIIIGVILMVTTPAIRLGQVQFSGFVTGAILGFLGLFYLVELQ